GTADPRRRRRGSDRRRSRRCWRPRSVPTGSYGERRLRLPRAPPPRRRAADPRAARSARAPPPGSRPPPPRRRSRSKDTEPSQPSESLSGRSRAQDAASAPSGLARRRPRAARGAQRRPGGDGALSLHPGFGCERPPRRHRDGRLECERLRTVGGAAPGRRAVHRLHRALATVVRGALHAGRRGGLAARARRLGPWVRDGSGARRAGIRLRSTRADGDRVVHGARERSIAWRDGAPGHDARPRRRLRPPEAARRPSAAPPRPVSTRARRLATGGVDYAIRLESRAFTFERPRSVSPISISSARISTARPMPSAPPLASAQYRGLPT